MILRLLINVLSLLFLSGCTYSQNPVNLTFATWGSATEINILKDIIADFEENNPDIKIVLQHIPQNYFKKLHLLFASGSEPDVVLINNQNIPTYAEYLLSLKEVSTRGYYPNSIVALSYQGELKAIPRDISTLAMYYNKNLVSPKQNWTYQDLLNDGAILRTEKKYAIALEQDLFYLYPFLLAFGDKLEKLTPKNILAQNGTKFFRSLSLDYHYAPQISELGMATPAECFLNQKCAYYLSGRWMSPKLYDVATFPWGVVEMPLGYSGNAVPCDATGWGISKRSVHVNESVRFIKYLSSNESLAKMSRTGLIVPARISVAEATVDSAVFLNLARKSSPITYPPKYDKYRDKINQELKIESR